MDKQNVLFVGQNIVQSWTGMKYWRMPPPDEPWNVMLMQEARHKRPHFMWLHLYKMSRLRKSMEAENRLMVARLLGAGELRSTRCLFAADCFPSLELESDGGYTMLQMCNNPLNLHSWTNMVNCTLCKCYQIKNSLKQPLLPLSL
jgi:hypothetical protein